MTIKTVEVKLPGMHYGQREVFTDSHRFRVLACGRRWGKTRLGTLVAIEGAVSGGRVWWVAPTYQTTQIAWRQIEGMAAQLPGVEVRRGDFTIGFPSGGTITFRSSSEPDNLRGEGIDMLIMDEAAYQSEYAWTSVLRPALSDRKGRAFIVSTPAEDQGWFREAWERGQQDDPEWKSWRFPSVSNPFLDPAEIEQAKTDVSHIEFLREYEAEFVSSAGALVSPAHIKTGTPPPGLSPVLGVDLAIRERETSDYTAWVALAQDRQGNLWVLDAGRARAGFYQVQNLIQERARALNPHLILIEAVQYQLAVVQELMRTTSLPVAPALPKGDKVSRFQPLLARYEQGLVYHSGDLPEDFRRELLAFPVGEHDDQVDALVYAFQGLNRARARQTSTLRTGST